MLDVTDFVVEKGGDPNKIRESQRRRHAPEAIVDDVVALYEDHKKSTMLTHPTLLYLVVLTRLQQSMLPNS